MERVAATRALDLTQESVPPTGYAGAEDEQLVPEDEEGHPVDVGAKLIGVKENFPVTMVRSGRGKPVTIIARGGSYRASEALRHGLGVRGLRVAFDYEASRYFEPVAKRRREAERDAGEVLGIATELGALRAIGSSRGARAVVGAMAEMPYLFERVVLLLPPGGHAAGRYAPWLASLREESNAKPDTEILVIARRGDSGHPVRVAEEWAEAIGGAVEVLTKAEFAEPDRIRGLIAGFLNS